jgi:hypothetical protein
MVTSRVGVTAFFMAGNKRMKGMGPSLSRNLDEICRYLSAVGKSGEPVNLAKP